MLEYECHCIDCGDFFYLKTSTPELGFIQGICPSCGQEDEHEMYDEPIRRNLSGKSTSKLHSTDECPEYKSHILVYYDNGSHRPVLFWAFDFEWLQKNIFGGIPETGPALWWSYLPEYTGDETSKILKSFKEKED